MPPPSLVPLIIGVLVPAFNSKTFEDGFQDRTLQFSNFLVPEASYTLKYYEEPRVLVYMDYSY